MYGLQPIHKSGKMMQSPPLRAPEEMIFPDCPTPLPCRSIRFPPPVLLCCVTTTYILVYIGCLGVVIKGIYNSESRWAALGYSALGFVIPIALGALAGILIAPHMGSVMDTNSALNTIGDGINLACPMGAVVGILKATSRKKPQPL